MPVITRVLQALAKLPEGERDRPLLLASGRAMRTAANSAVQRERMARGELDGEERRVNVLDRVTITREGARQMRGCQGGRIVENSGAALWVHGHTHTSCDYMAGGTRVVCNPKGYGPQSRSGAIENDEFKPELVIEI